MELKVESLHKFSNRSDLIFNFLESSQTNILIDSDLIKKFLDKLEILIKGSNSLFYFGPISYGQEKLEDNFISEWLIYSGKEDLIILLLFIDAYQNALKSFKNENNIKTLETSIQSSLEVVRYDEDQISKLQLTKNFSELNPETIPIETNEDYYKIKQKILEWLNEGFFPFEIEDILKQIFIILVELDSNEEKSDNISLIEAIDNVLNNKKTLEEEITPLEQEFFNSYWTRLISKIKHSDLRNFLNYFLDLNSNEFLSKEDLYLDFINQFKVKENKEQSLEEIIKFASVYNNILYSNESNFSEEIKELLSYFKIIEDDRSFLLLLNLFFDLENNLLQEEDLIRLLKLILSYSVRRMIIGRNINSEVFLDFYSKYKKELLNNNQFQEILNDIFDEYENTSNYFPTNIEVLNSLKIRRFFSEDRLAQLLFSLILNSESNNNILSSIDLEKIISIQFNPRYPNLFDQSLILSINTLGNFTLSNSYSFNLDKKRPKVLFEDISNAPNQPIKNIEERTEKLSNLIIELLPYYKQSLKYPDSILDITIKESINRSEKKDSPYKDVTNQEKINQVESVQKIITKDLRDLKENEMTYADVLEFTFNGKKFSVSNYREFRTKIIELLYKKDINGVLKLANFSFIPPGRSRFPFITYYKDILRMPELVIDEIYIEGNLSHDMTIKNLIYVLNELDSEVEIFVTYRK